MVYTLGVMETVIKLQTLQKRALQQQNVLFIINNKRYRSSTDPIFKSENILKITDIHKLHISLFMFDYYHKALPKCFEHYIPTNNLATNTIITRQHNKIRTGKPRTHFLLSYLYIILQTYGIILIIRFKISNPDINSNL